MKSSYNQEHWESKIAAYLNEEWSQKPSPFVRLAAKYFKPSGRVLELGAGAGQDGLWLEKQGFAVTLTDGNTSAFDVIAQKSIKHTKPIAMDVTGEFPFEDATFDVVYAQLVLHYFDDETMNRIMNEAHRVLGQDGVIAIMVNTIEDPEYTSDPTAHNGFIETDKLLKRYFSIESLAPFVGKFKPIVFDNRGRTPKDDAVGNSGMIQFIGEKY